MKGLESKTDKEVIRTNVEWEKERVLILNTPLKEADFLTRVYYGIKRQLLDILPASYYYRKALSVRICDCS